MFHRWNTFSKLALLIVLMFLSLVLIYSYTNTVSVNVVEQSLREKNLKRLSFFGTQLDNTIDRLSSSAIVVSRDPSIKELGSVEDNRESFEQLEAEEATIQKLSLLSATSTWTNRLTIYFPKVKRALSNDYSSIYTDESLKRITTALWEYHAGQTSSDSEGYFSKKISNPLLVNRSLIEANAVVEVRFDNSQLIRMLNEYKNDETMLPFFYKPSFDMILGTAAETGISNEIANFLSRQVLGDSGSLNAEINHEKYMVDYIRLNSLGWYVIDYTPLNQVLAPITNSRNLFYIAISLMLMISIIFIVFLYRRIQRPIQVLLNGVKMIQTGSYSHRLNYLPRNEFDFLFAKFNDMAEEIQRLLEKVYMENIRFRDAQLKHLQSQINPHFFANSMFFVKNMIAIDDKQAATKMILSLSEYFRYITKIEHTLTTVEEELRLIDNYLTIQNLRIERFHYEMDIPESMRQLQIPRLTLQPIVENIIIHGIEKSNQYGIISITGEQQGEECRIIIDDNGNGLSEEQLAGLGVKVSLPLDPEGGCGLWNVHQRLNYQFNENAGLLFSPSPLGGLRVTIAWKTGL
ncbi:sensor histidine kinase [Paenibacillus agricola]|uniref:Histidine kinase n=1 Tax=Paenibacillus agricola TaxID=2716264 RepID=A0ABX0JAG2_9BACL|nr:histidine kinase [Paenibacillus agricola]NHN32380.1 histidine kinase [Paenibacillus agricola]